MGLLFPVILGSVRRDRQGIKAARYIVDKIAAHGRRRVLSTKPIAIAYEITAFGCTALGILKKIKERSESNGLHVPRGLAVPEHGTPYDETASSRSFRRLRISLIRL